MNQPQCILMNCKGGGLILIKNRKGSRISKADKCVCLSDTSLPLLVWTNDAV